MSWPRTIGIVGGLGPHAHLRFEQALLAAVESPRRDQDYPPWILSSMPGTPDRTDALLHGGPSPVPALLEGLRRVAHAADFAVIPCNTAHAFIDPLRRSSPLPVLSMVEATIDAIRARLGPTARVGLLGTTGLLKSRIYPSAGPGFGWSSPLTLPDGASLQQARVMRPIYGSVRGDGSSSGDGLKSGGRADGETGALHAETLMSVAGLLVDHGAECIVTACTEIPLVFAPDTFRGVPVFDPLACTARRALAIARGAEPLPAAGFALPESAVESPGA